MKKRLKISINGVTRDNQIENIEEIEKILRRKWLLSALTNSDEVNIQVFPVGYLEEYTQAGWSISGGDNTIIKLKDCAGIISEFDINKLIQEQISKTKEKEVDLFENVIEQAKLIYLTGEHKNFECAFKHIQNRINYERKQLSSTTGKLNKGGK